MWRQYKFFSALGIQNTSTSHPLAFKIPERASESLQNRFVSIGGRSARRSPFKCPRRGRWTAKTSGVILFVYILFRKQTIRRTLYSDAFYKRYIFATVSSWKRWTDRRCYDNFVKKMCYYAVVRPAALDNARFSSRFREEHGWRTTTIPFSSLSRHRRRFAAENFKRSRRPESERGGSSALVWNNMIAAIPGDS